MPFPHGALCVLALLAANCGGQQPASGALHDRAGTEGPEVSTGDPPLDSAALNKLLQRARAENSDAVVVMKDGVVLVNEWFGGVERPIIAMSASKSIAAIAVVHLVESGKLNLEQRLESLFPELAGTPKAAITIRQLLSHTSGLPRSRADSGRTISILDQVIGETLQSPPGSKFLYSNMAVDFLSVVVHRASGQHLDEFLQEHLFDALRIHDASWLKDREGHPLAAGELKIRATDLAKVGQLMLDGGLWKGTRVLSQRSVSRLTAAGQAHDPRCGLLWWRRVPVEVVLTSQVVETWESAGLSGKALAAVQRMLGRPFDSDQQFRETLWAETARDTLVDLKGFFGKNPNLPFATTRVAGPVEAFAARGWLGQRLVVVPESGIVAVRMREAQPSDYRDTSRSRDSYPNFEEDVLRIGASNRVGKENR